MCAPLDRRIDGAAPLSSMRAQVVHPRAGRVEHQPGVDPELGAVRAVLQLGTGDPAAGEAQPGDLGVVEDHGARFDGGTHRHDGHPRVVHLVVAVDRDRLEVVGAQRRVVGRGPGRGDDPADTVAEGGQRRVGEDAGAQLGRAVRAALVDGQVEGERVDQVRGHVLGQHPPLVVVLRDQLDRAGLQVAQPAVHQLGGRGGGGAGEVAGVHHRHPQPRLRGVPGDRGAQDAAADHQQVVRRVGEQFPGLGAAGVAPAAGCVPRAGTLCRVFIVLSSPLRSSPWSARRP